MRVDVRRLRACALCNVAKPPSGFRPRRPACIDCEPDGFRYCCQCRQVKSVTEFYTRPGRGQEGGEGPISRCKPCSLTKSKEWQRTSPKAKAIRRRAYLKRTPEQRAADRARTAAWASDPENRKRKNAMDREYYLRMREDPEFVEAERERMRRYNAVHGRTIGRRFRERHQERINAGNREDRRRWRQENPDVPNLDKLRFFGLTADQWRAILASQGGVCASCGGLPVGKVRWHTDHDHETGNVRGILCNHCNVGLGCLGDTLESVRARTAQLIAYLESVHTRMALAGITPKPRRPRNPHAHLELHHAPRVFRPSPVVTYGQ